MIGLVEHADLHIAQVAVPLLDEVGQPPGAGDDDVHAITQGRHLGILPGAAEDGGHAQIHGPGQRREHGLDLAGQLTGGHEDEATRAAGAGVTVGQPGDHRDRERERLAGAGAAPAQDVQPGQRIRQRGGLDRERRGDAGRGQGGHQRLGDAEIREGRAGQGGHVGQGSASAARPEPGRAGMRGPAACPAGPGQAGAGVGAQRDCSMGRAVKGVSFGSGWPHLAGRHIRGNQLAHRAMYDRRAP